VQKVASEMFAKIAAGDYGAAHPNIRAAVLGDAVYRGGVKEYEAALEIHRKTDGVMKLEALSALGSTVDPALMARALEFTTSKDVRSMDMHVIPYRMASTAAGVKLSFEWMVKNFPLILERLPPKSVGVFGHVIRASSSFCTWEDHKRVADFFKTVDTSQFAMVVGQILDGIQSRASWVDRDRDDVHAWLVKHKYLKAYA